MGNVPVGLKAAIPLIVVGCSSILRVIYIKLYMKILCKKCNSRMIVRTGKYGKFWACPQSTKEDNHGTLNFHEGFKPQSTGGIREITFNDSPIQGVGNVHYSYDDEELDWGMGHLVGLDGWGGD